MPEFQEHGEYPFMNVVLLIVDNGAVLFFALEYGVRFLCSPRKLRFLMRKGNWHNSEFITGRWLFITIVYYWKFIVTIVHKKILDSLPYFGVYTFIIIILLITIRLKYFGLRYK